MKARRFVWSMLLAACTTIFCALPAEAQSVVAGEPPTAKIMLNPVPAKVGSYPPLVGGGANIVGNELSSLLKKASFSCGAYSTVAEIRDQLFADVHDARLEERL